MQPPLGYIILNFTHSPFHKKKVKTVNKRISEIKGKQVLKK